MLKKMINMIYLLTALVVICTIALTVKFSKFFTQYYIYNNDEKGIQTMLYLSTGVFILFTVTIAFSVVALLNREKRIIEEKIIEEDYIELLRKSDR